MLYQLSVFSSVVGKFLLNLVISCIMCYDYYHVLTSYKDMTVFTINDNFDMFEVYFVTFLYK